MNVANFIMKSFIYGTIYNFIVLLYMPRYLNLYKGIYEKHNKYYQLHFSELLSSNHNAFQLTTHILHHPILKKSLTHNIINLPNALCKVFYLFISFYILNVFVRLSRLLSSYCESGIMFRNVE